MARYKCVIIPQGDPNMRDLQVESSDGFWTSLGTIPRDECRNYVNRDLTTRIVKAYVSKNNVIPTALPHLIFDVHGMIAAADASIAERSVGLTPAVPIESSVKQEYIVSLENGRRYKSLKRHLSTLGMTPDEYRTKWRLPADYPMVSRDYSRQRSETARASKLERSSPAPGAAPSPRGTKTRKML